MSPDWCGYCDSGVGVRVVSSDWCGYCDAVVVSAAVEDAACEYMKGSAVGVVAAGGGDCGSGD